MNREPKTLGDVNELLQEAGISPVSAECLEEMKSLVGRKRLVTALQSAPHDRREKARVIGYINAGNRPWGPDTASISKMLKDNPRMLAPESNVRPIRGVENDASDYLSVKAYGKKAALSFEADETRAGAFTSLSMARPVWASAGMTGRTRSASNSQQTS